MAENNKKSVLKKLAVAGLLLIVLVLAIAGLSESIFHANVNIKDFNKELGEVSMPTRRLLRAELEKIAELNSGEQEYSADFALREGSKTVIDNEDGKSKYASIYVDSDKLQISLFVQMNWGTGFAKPNEAYIVRIECADKDHWKYETNHCVDIDLDEPLESFEEDNLKLLESYGVDVSAVGSLRHAGLKYLKTVEPNTRAALIRADSIEENGEQITADLYLDFNLKYQIRVDKGKNSTITISRNGSELWSYQAEVLAKAKHPADTLRNILPVELSTDNGTDYMLRWAGNNKLKINSDRCQGSDNNESVIKSAKAWIEKQNYSPEDFEISLIKSCLQ